MISSVDELRGECEKNLDKATKERNTIHQTSVLKLKSLEAQIDKDAKNIVSLKEIREDIVAKNKLIENHTDENILKIVYAQHKGFFTIDKFNQSKQKIKSNMELYRSSSNIEDKQKHLKNAIDIAFLCAKEEGRSYDFKQDKFGVKSLLLNKLEFELGIRSKKVIDKMNEDKRGLIEVLEDINSLKDSLSNTGNSNYEQKLATLEKEWEKTIQENTKLNNTVVELELQRVQLNNDLEKAFEIMGEPHAAENETALMGASMTYDTSI